MMIAKTNCALEYNLHLLHLRYRYRNRKARTAYLLGVEDRIAETQSHPFKSRPPSAQEAWTRAPEYLLSRRGRALLH